jgi:hypothetical protein
MLGGRSIFDKSAPAVQKKTPASPLKNSRRGLIICEMFDKTLSLTPTLVP